MTQISNLVANDPRSAWEKISRRHLWRGADKLGIQYPPGATHEQMVNILVAAGKSPEEVTKWVPLIVTTPEGQKTVMVPEEKERKYDEAKELRRNEEFEKRIQAAVEKDEKEKQERLTQQDAKITSIEKDLHELKEMMGKLVEVVAQKPTQKREKKPETLETMHWKKFQKLAKQHGIDWTTKDPREPVIEKING